jgi:T5orf172 domain
MKGYIYLIHAKGTKLYKIGMTNRSIESRLKQLNGMQSPHELILTHSIEVSNVREAEKYFHKLYFNCRYHNEWFKFSRLTLVGVIRCMNFYEKGKHSSTLSSSIFIGFSMMLFFGFFSGTISISKIQCFSYKLTGYSCNK